MMAETKETLRDWQGNVPREGDVVMFVNIFRQQRLDGMIYQDPIRKTFHKVKVHHGELYGFGWAVFWESKVFKHEGISYITVPPEPGGVNAAVPIDLCWDLHVTYDGGARGNFFCIKGKSDSHELFFKNYFRYNMSGLN